MIVIVIVIFQEGTQLTMAVFSGALKKKINSIHALLTRKMKNKISQFSLNMMQNKIKQFWVKPFS